MRILHVVSTLAPTSGGPTQVLKHLAVAQARSGHEVTVCTTDRSHPVKETLADSYFRSFYPDAITLKVFPVAFAPLLFSPALGRWLQNEISAFDLIHIHGTYRFPPTYAAYLARKLNIPYIIRPHGNLDPYLYRTSSRSVWLKRIYERWFDLPNLNAASAIHFTADEERERASFLNLQAPTFIIPNGLDWEPYSVLPSRGRLRMDWGLGQSPVVLFLGRLHFKKGIDLLVQAFDAVRKMIPEAKLVIAGPENDAYGSKVRQWVRERQLDDLVYFAGPLQSDEVIQAYVDADVFVLPSYTENFGMTVAEAMACGLPVVISDQVNICHEVARAGAGLVTRCEPDEIAQALITLLKEPQDRQSMGQAGRRLVQSHYRWPSIVDSLTEEYESIINCHSAMGNKTSRVELTNAPFMTVKERELFKKSLNIAKSYFEFGSGGSTVWAVGQGLDVFGVESDRNWVKALKKKLGEQCKIEAVDIGPTKGWGYPVSTQQAKKFPAYSQAILQYREPFDLILVDGRFRVACTMAAIQHILTYSQQPEEARIFIHDFWNRPQYHVVLLFLNVVEEDEAAGVFKIKPEADLGAVGVVWEEYSRIPD